MAFEGMDVDAVTNIYQQMHNMGQQLQTIITSMQSVVSNLEQAWVGPDSKQFASQWPSHQAQLQSALQSIEEMAAHTLANLHQQQQTSQSLA